MSSILERLNKDKHPRFFPAVSVTTTGYLSKYTDNDLRERSDNITQSLRFFNSSDDQYFSHPYVLISAAHHFDKTDNVKEWLSIDDEALVFIDSGGYSLASGAITEDKWDDAKAFKWSMNNGDIFPILDRPLIPDCDFDEHLELSVKSAKYYAENRGDSDKLILNVVQGRTDKELKTWLSEISKIKLDGWAHGGHKGNMINIVSVILDMIDMGLMEESKIHHVFGVTSSVAMLYFMVIQDELRNLGYDVRLTYDSSYFQRSLAFGNYFLYNKFDGMINIKLSNRYDWKNMPADAKLPCACPICSDIKDVPAFIDDSVQFYLLAPMHNLLKQLSYKTSIENLIHMGFDDMLKDALSANVWHNISVIKKAFSMEPKAGKSLMRSKFKSKQVETGSSAPKLGNFT